MAKQIINVGAAPSDNTGESLRSGGTKINANFTEVYDAVALNTNKVTNATHTGDATGATALTLATVNSNVGSFTKANITVNAKGLVTAASNGSSYLVYTALLTQTGTDAPVATVLENTLGGTVVWTYGGTGSYTGTLTAAFTTSKTYVSITNPDYLKIAAIFWIDVDSVSISVWDNDSGITVDNVLLYTPIEIRVYP